MCFLLCFDLLLAWRFQVSVPLQGSGECALYSSPSVDKQARVRHIYVSRSLLLCDCHGCRRDAISRVGLSF